MPKYIAGGIYPHEDEFSAVRPSGKGDLPYVSSHPHGSLWSSTKHHAHYSRVDGNTAFLEKESWEAELVGAPASVRLSWELLREIEESFEKYDYK